MDNGSQMKDFFDRLAPTWEDNGEDYGVREKLVEMMKLPGRAVIADIGCGKGVMLPHLLERSPERILAIDFSSNMLEGAKRRHKDSRITFINDDLLEVDLPALDAAVLFNGYPHFLDKRALAAKLAAHVKPGGIVIVAHSKSKKEINGVHRGAHPFQLSIPLRDTAAEAAEFSPYFQLDQAEDTEELYFIRMLRADGNGDK